LGADTCFSFRSLLERAIHFSEPALCISVEAFTKERNEDTGEPFALLEAHPVIRQWPNNETMLTIENATDKKTAKPT